MKKYFVSERNPRAICRITDAISDREGNFISCQGITLNLEDEEEGNLELIQVVRLSEILEFPDDKSALLWFNLEYGG